jgi:hypothetical protein
VALLPEVLTKEDQTRDTGSRSTLDSSFVEYLENIEYVNNGGFFTVPNPYAYRCHFPVEAIDDSSDTSSESSLDISNLEDEDYDEFKDIPIVPFWIDIGSYSFSFKLYSKCHGVDIRNCLIDELTKDGALPAADFYLKRGSELIDDDDPVTIQENDHINAMCYIVGGNKNGPSKGKKNSKNKNKNKNSSSSKKRGGGSKRQPMPYEPFEPKYPKPRNVPLRASVSPCAMKFAAACLKPFSVQARGVCNPNGSERFTQKAQGFVRTVLAIGSSNVGFLLISPVVVNDCVSLWASNTLFTGTRASPLGATNTPVAGVIGVPMSNLPYSSTQLVGGQGLVQPPVAGRIVAVGIRCVYVGQENNMGGMYYALQDPFHSNVCGMGVSDISTFRQSMRKPINRETFEFTMYPLTNQEDNFPYQVGTVNGAQNATFNTYPFSQNGDSSFYTSYGGGTAFTYQSGTTSVYTGAPSGILLVTGSASNNFEVEVIMHVEYSGQLAQNMLTTAHSDIVGGQAVRSAISTAEEQAGNSGKGTYDIVSKFNSALNWVLSEGTATRLRAATNTAKALSGSMNALRITDF